MTRHKAIGYVLVAALLVVAAFGYVNAFGKQAHYSDQILPETANALAYVHMVDPESDSAIVVNSFSIRWWTGALYKRPAPNVWDWPPPERWQAEYEHVRCVMGWVAGCDAIQAASALNARWVLVDTSFPDRNGTTIADAPPDQWDVTASADWLELVYSEGDTRLWRITEIEKEDSYAIGN